MKKIKKPGWWDEFKTFAIKGNAMALAVGTIIGGAFSTITKSLTNDLIMPVVNIFLGGADFSDIKIKLPQMPWVETKYELIVDELGKKKEEEAPAEEPAPPAPSAEEVLLTEIRDLLAKK